MYNPQCNMKTMYNLYAWKIEYKKYRHCNFNCKICPHRYEQGIWEPGEIKNNAKIDKFYFLFRLIQ